MAESNPATPFAPTPSRSKRACSAPWAGNAQRTYNHVISKARLLVTEHQTFKHLQIDQIKMGCIKGAVHKESMGHMTICEHYFLEDEERARVRRAGMRLFLLDPAPSLVMAADLYPVTQTPPLVPAAGGAARPGADIAPATLLLLHVQRLGVAFER